MISWKLFESELSKPNLTSCYLNISCQLSEKCLETFTSSSKTVLQRTEQERQSSYCSAHLQDSSVHCTGLLTAQTLIQSTTRSGVCFRSECIEVAYTMSIIWAASCGRVESIWSAHRGQGSERMARATQSMCQGQRWTIWTSVKVAINSTAKTALFRVTKNMQRELISWTKLILFCFV